MSDELWFRFHPSKFMAGIRGLNANEVKVYICIICRIYESDGPIREDAEILSTYCEMRPSSFAKALDRLVRLEKVIRTYDGMLTNRACEREISHRASKSQKSARAAQISHEKRQENQSTATASAVRPLANIEKIREDKRRVDSGDGSARDESSTLREQILEAMGHHPTGVTATGKIFGTQADMAEVARWLALPAITPDNLIEEIRRVSAQKRGPPPNTFSYYTKAIQRLSGELTKEALTPTAPDPQKGQAHGSSKSTDRFHAFIGGAIGSQGMDRGPDPDPTQPLLAGGRSS
jgi:uncharacterized protein YdaU (DUF1376 family)